MTFNFSGRPTWQFLRDETATLIRERINTAGAGARCEIQRRAASDMSAAH